MLSKTLEFMINNSVVKVAVHTATGRSYLLRQMLYRNLPTVADDISAIGWTWFTRALTQSMIDGDLGFKWPSVVDSAAELSTAFESWFALPENVIELWTDALFAVDEPPQPTELTPAAEKNA